LIRFDARAYTDGGARIDVGVGGWGVHIITENGVKELYGGELRADSNRMELTAASVALAHVPLGSRTALYSDSSYVVDGLKIWLPTWKGTNQISDTVPRTNGDVWRKIRNLLKYRKVHPYWVKAHSGNHGNNRADALATKGMEDLLYGEQG
jgi:ribonuclease HI